jgi:hypothetical protein
MVVAAEMQAVGVIGTIAGAALFVHKKNQCERQRI